MYGLQRIALYCHFIDMFLKEIGGILKEADKKIKCSLKIIITITYS